MILRTLALALLIALCGAVALALMVAAANVLRPVVTWIASDERTAWGCVAAFTVIGLAVVMEGKNKR